MTRGLSLQVFIATGIDEGQLDGQTPKRRGPKPNSKPAATRRVELNRQAQRYHDEEKDYATDVLTAVVGHIANARNNMCAC